ncbi:MarR family winged helix-turn-helix transcriptional regulator [Thermomonospora umbrina]|uniref:DNA-binding MarR family transcriptional regulator n=1 Tax=Thermomonospora umbrina TaxID=111806 RepID=A0A3D9SSK9_9ACTN|nr:MarR family transcriptional regulator [Thermomonospora umbrina]REE95955.1 DNA-binding MarR family transcriptional regulator [Thermomonospora umbrina]
MNEPLLQAQYEQLLESLRAYGAIYREFSRRFAAWLGLHSTDAEALIEILGAEERGALLSPARLSERIALSSGATTALLNRLERAGHVVRTRETADRRVVTLRSSPRVQDLADEFFGPLAGRVDEVMSQYPPELLERFETFLTELRGAMDAQLAAEPPRPPSAP